MPACSGCICRQVAGATEKRLKRGDGDGFREHAQRRDARREVVGFCKKLTGGGAGHGHSAWIENKKMDVHKGGARKRAGDQQRTCGEGRVEPVTAVGQALKQQNGCPRGGEDDIHCLPAVNQTAGSGAVDAGVRTWREGEREARGVQAPLGGRRRRLQWDGALADGVKHDRSGRAHFQVCCELNSNSHCITRLCRSTVVAMGRAVITGGEGKNVAVLPPPPPAAAASRSLPPLPPPTAPPHVRDVAAFLAVPLRSMRCCPPTLCAKTDSEAAGEGVGGRSREGGTA